MNGIKIAPTALPVTTRIGQLPRLWNGSTLFFTDLYAIFYGEPEKTHQLKTSVDGFFGYGGRLIPILDLLYQGGDNLLLLQEPADPHVLDYFGNRLGLSIPAMRVIDHHDYHTFHEGLSAQPELMAFLRGHPAPSIDGYVTDPHLETMARELGKGVVNSYQESRDANNKVGLTRFLTQAGLPVFAGGEVAPGAPLEHSLNDLRRQGYRRAVVRSAWGASGFGVATVDLGDGVPKDFPHHLMVEDSVLVQGWIEPGINGFDEVTSPSVQFFIDDDRITLFDLTGQLLKNHSIHEGNVAPPLDLSAEPEVTGEILRQSVPVVQWVGATGYRGTGSIDFLVYREHGAPRVTVCEVNARVTGATYPSFLARHFHPDGGWLMRNFAFEPVMTCGDLLAALEQHGHLYVPGREEGVLPINFICDEQGRVIKCQLLFLARDARRCTELIRPDLKGLPVRGVYARD